MVSVHRRAELRPAGPFRMPTRWGRDGLVRRRGTVVERLLHHHGQPVVVRAAQTAADRVVIGAWAQSAPAAEHGIARMRFVLGVDEDLREFQRSFRDDPLIGRSVRARPWLRVARRPDPFEALAFAICEQLIEYERAAAIQRRLVRRLGRRCAVSGLRDLPGAERLAGAAPAELEGCDLSAGRSLALRRAAREVAAGRVDLEGPDHQRAWRRLRAIPGIGSWTVEMLALCGQGRHDQLPAGDLKLIKLVGKLLSGGDPRARAGEGDVRVFFQPYGQWSGLAATHLLTGKWSVGARL